MENIILTTLIALVSILLAIVGFFLKSLITKLDSGNNQMHNIQTNVAVILEKLSGYKGRIDDHSEQFKLVWKAIEDIRKGKSDV